MIHYRAVHDGKSWRKVSIHKSLESAISGKDGAIALLQRRGRVGEKWNIYGKPFGVFVWDSSEAEGYLYRLSLADAVEFVNLPVSEIFKFEQLACCSQSDIDSFFNRPTSLADDDPVAGDAVDTSTLDGSDVLIYKEIQRLEPVREISVKEWVLNQARGICEFCGVKAPFMTDENESYLEVHHVRFLSCGGSDTVSNAVAVCPNCHRAFHYSKDRDELAARLYRGISRLVME
jgi:5-methylcytosine-specific restriction endonuclease McrA